MLLEGCIVSLNTQSREKQIERRVGTAILLHMNAFDTPYFFPFAYNTRVELGNESD